MSLNRIALIIVSLAAPPLALASFSVPLVAAVLTAPQVTAFGADRTAEVTPDNWQTTLDGWGVVAGEDLYESLETLFSQVIKPERAIVGRRLTAVAQISTATVDATPTDGTYAITIDGITVSFVAVAQTQAQVRDGLIAAIEANAILGPRIVAVSGGGGIVQMTAAFAGRPFTVSATLDGSASSEIVVATTTPSVGLHTDLAQFNAERTDWYFLLETTHDQNNVIPTASTVQAFARPLFYVAQTDDADVETSATTDVASVLQDFGYTRTLYLNHDNDDAFLDAATVGRLAPTAPGSATWANKELIGVVGRIPTSEAFLVAKNAGWYESFEAANTALTQHMRVSSGTPADLIIAADFLQNLVQIRYVEGLRNADKIPYRGGEGILGAILQGALDEAAADPYKIIDPDSIVVTVPKASAQSSTDRGNRHFPNIRAQALLTGAVETLEATIVLTP